MARTLVAGGTVVSMDPEIGELRRGDVLIDDGVIVAVAPSLVAGDGEVIDASGMVVMPGLVDSHRHLWYSPMLGSGMDHALPDLGKSVFQVRAHFTPDDLYAATRAGIAYALHHGITTVLDECQVINSPEHASEAIRAHKELPVRAVFTCGASMEFDSAAKVITRSDWSLARRLRETELSRDDARVTMALALPDPAAMTPGLAGADVQTARELALPMQVNVGLALGPKPRHGIRVLADLELLGPDMNFVHCCTTSEDEFRFMAAAGATTATSCPMTEIAVGLGLPALGRMRECGVAPAIGTDALCAANGDLFEQARVGLLLDRARAAAEVFAQERAVETARELGTTTRQALEMITINGARACGLSDRVGSLIPGKAADLILLRATDLGLSPLTDPIATIVSCAHGSNVDTVLVAGHVVKRSGQLIGVDMNAITLALVSLEDRLHSAARNAGLLPA